MKTNKNDTKNIIEVVGMLISEGKEIKKKGLKTIPKDGSEEYAIWMNKVFSFNEQYLQDNPLHVRIHNASQGYNIYEDSYKEIMTSLTAVLEMLTIECKSSNDEFPKTTDTGNKKVFVVYGHDENTKLSVMNYLSSLNLIPIDIAKEANSGQSILGKIEEYSDVRFAVVLYTPCDLGRERNEKRSKGRARQNVIFEHGYLMAKLGKHNIAMLVKGKVEIPSDVMSPVHIKMGNDFSWQNDLIKELINAGLVDN